MTLPFHAVVKTIYFRLYQWVFSLNILSSLRAHILQPCLRFLFSVTPYWKWISDQRLIGRNLNLQTCDKTEFNRCYTPYAFRVFTVPYSLFITCLGLLIIFESFSYHFTSGCRVQLFSICILLFFFFYPLVVILCLQVTLFGQSLELHLPPSPHIFSIY